MKSLSHPLLRLQIISALSVLFTLDRTWRLFSPRGNFTSSISRKTRSPFPIPHSIILLIGILSHKVLLRLPGMTEKSLKPESFKGKDRTCARNNLHSDRYQKACNTITVIKAMRANRNDAQT